MNYNNKNINIISFFLSLSIFLIIISTLKDFSSRFNQSFNISKTYINNESTNQICKDIEANEIKEWRIKIDKLNLSAVIKDGTDESIIRENVGHYTMSNYLYGNIALKAYNIGEYKNYFANLKELEIGDEIQYIINEEKYNYKVAKNLIIDDEEIEVRKAEKNTLTLITYIKDLPQKRRCVVANKV